MCPHHCAHDKEENKIQKTSIEWGKNPDGTQGYTWNPITGCLNHINGMCKGGNFPCYAASLANGRLKPRYLANKNISPTFIFGEKLANRAYNDPFFPRFWPERLNSGMIDRGNKGIFVCDMSDLFGIGIPDEWTRRVLQRIREKTNHRFYLLTKQPQNLAKFSPFPDNCYVGVTATNTEMFYEACYELKYVKAKVKYLSLEPLIDFDERTDTLDMLNWIKNWLGEGGINWVILGAMTCSGGDLAKVSSQFPELTPKPFGNRYVLLPKIEWVEEIVNAADKASVKVFLKDNLNPMFTDNDCKLFKGHRDTLFTFKDFESNGGTRWHLRQEMPSIGGK